MSLQKQLAHLNMSGGLQRKDDQFLVIPSKLAVADNCEFDDASTVISRGGQSKVDLTTGPVSSLAVGQAARLFTHNGGALIESRGAALPGLSGGVHRINPSGGTSLVYNQRQTTSFTEAYRFRRAGMVTDRVTSIDRKGSAYGAGTPFYDGSYDFAIVDGYRYYAVETRDTSGSGRQTIKYTIVNDASGFVVAEGLISDGTNVLVKPRIVTSTGKTTYLYFASFTSGAASFSVKVASLSSSGIGTINSVLTTAATGGFIENTVNDAALFDAAYTSDGAKIGLVVRDATAAGTTILFRDLSTSDGYTIVTSNTGTASARITALTCLMTVAASTYRVHAFYGIGTAVAKGMYLTVGGGVSAETTVGTAPAGTTGRITAYEDGASYIYLAFDALTSPGGSTLISTTRLSRCSHTYGTLTECASTSPWMIAGRIAACQSRLYLPMAFVSSQYQSTYYIVDLSDAFFNLGTAGNAGPPRQVLARIDYGEGALNFSRWQLTTRLPNLSVSGDQLNFAYLKYETDLRIAGTTVETPYALHRANIDLASQLEHAEINGLTFLAGACPYVYDGSNMVEEGFHHGPEIDLGATLGGSGYELPNVAGNYTVCFTLAWQDAAGNWWESAPSNQRTFTVGANRFIPTTALILPPTQKAAYMILMYRTPALGTNTSLYLASKTDGTFVTSDTDLVNGEQLYTAGNVLPNTPAPACRHVSVFQKRLVLSGCGDGSRVYWSKQTTPGYAVEFNSGDPTHQTKVPSDKGRVAATKEMDDHLVILCESGVGIIGGQGPDPTGTSGQYSEFASIITETGCSWDSPKSAIRGPEGVWFRSPFGLRLVSRSGALARSQDGKQVGAEVDPLVSGTVVGVAGTTKQQIRFYQPSGTVLVWDYQWQQWTRFTGFANVDACYADGRFYHLSNYSTSSPLLRYTNDSVFLDVDDANNANSYFQMVLETPWLSFAGIQGFQRLYRLMLLGRTGGTKTYGLSFNASYNFEDTLEDGASATLTPAATTNHQFQMQHHFSKQKCESVKLRLSIDPDGTDVDGRIRITDLTLQVGVKDGYFKLPSSQRF